MTAYSSVWQLTFLTNSFLENHFSLNQPLVLSDHNGLLFHGGNMLTETEGGWTFVMGVDFTGDEVGQVWIFIFC